MFMSQEKLQTMSMQNVWGVKEVHYGIVQVVNGNELFVWSKHGYTDAIAKNSSVKTIIRKNNFC